MRLRAWVVPLVLIALAGPGRPSAAASAFVLEVGRAAPKPSLVTLGGGIRELGPADETFVVLVFFRGAW